MYILYKIVGVDIGRTWKEGEMIWRNRDDVDETYTMKGRKNPIKLRWGKIILFREAGNY